MLVDSEAERWNMALQNISDFAGEPLSVQEQVYDSEYSTAYGNRIRGLHAIRDIAGELGVGVFGPGPE